MNKHGFQIALTGMGTTSKVDELLYFQQLENREIFLGEYVDDSVIEEIVHHIIRWNREDAQNNTPIHKRKTIRIYINSYGGDLVACNSVIETMKISKTPVHTYNLGKAFSAGGLILMGGHHRFSLKDAVILIHQGSTGTQGTTSQVIDQVDFQKRQEKRVEAYILSVTNITPEQYKERWKEEWFFFGDEAIELGVVDELLTELPF